MADKKKVIKLLCEELNNLKNVIGYVEKVPSLKRTLISVLSPTYLNYISDIEQKSPKPATFRVLLANDFAFLLTYVGNETFEIKVSGKKFMSNIAGEIDNASKAISDLLVLKHPLNALQPTEEQELALPDDGSGDASALDLTQSSDEVNNSPFNPLGEPEEDEEIK